jgi:hypothetical protein
MAPMSERISDWEGSMGDPACLVARVHPVFPTLKPARRGGTAGATALVPEWDEGFFILEMTHDRSSLSNR